MPGGPSQLDLFDPKPELRRWHGKPLPPSLTKDLKLAFVKPNASVLASPRQFRHGRSGTAISDYLPHIASLADEICLVRSVQSDAFNHDPGELLLMTGSTELGRPALGSWVSYGLGSESQDLPAFVVLSSGIGTKRRIQHLVQRVPALDISGDPVSRRRRSDPLSLQPERHQSRDAEGAPGRVASAERETLERDRGPGDCRPHRFLRAGVSNADRRSGAVGFFEGAGSGAGVLWREPGATRQYGLHCLLARRMVERGVRFVMLSHGNWDDHHKLDAT